VSETNKIMIIIIIRQNVAALCPVIETQFAALLDQTEKEDSVPQSVRHYMTEMAELTELAKERLDQVKVECSLPIGAYAPRVGPGHTFTPLSIHFLFFCPILLFPFLSGFNYFFFFCPSLSFLPE